MDEGGGEAGGRGNDDGLGRTFGGGFAGVAATNRPRFDLTMIPKSMFLKKEKKSAMCMTIVVG